MTASIKPNYVLRTILMLAGAAIVFLGINVAAGGIVTLGWQGGGTGFIDVADPSQFAIHDNHIRFIGGVWLSVGLLMLAGGIAFRRLRSVLVALTAMIFVGGLARLTALDGNILLSAAIVPSFVLELVLFPLLGLWIAKAEQPALIPAQPTA